MPNSGFPLKLYWINWILTTTRSQNLTLHIHHALLPPPIQSLQPSLLPFDPSSDMQISLKQFLQENGILLLFSRNCMLLLLEVLYKHRVEHRWQKSWNIRRQRKRREKLGAQQVADLFRKEVSSMPQKLET